MACTVPASVLLPFQEGSGWRAPLDWSSSDESWWVWSGRFDPGAAVVAVHAQGHRQGPGQRVKAAPRIPEKSAGSMARADHADGPLPGCGVDGGMRAQA
jgi:hypothetical protein